MIEPKLVHFCDLDVELGSIIEMGEGRAGRRRIIPIIGGSVKGQLINGKILNIGADWQTIFSDGVAELDTRYSFQTHDGAVIEITNYGFRHGPADVIAALGRGETVDPSSYYMRTHARLETGDPRYKWVNSMLFVGTGMREASKVRVSLFQIT